MNDSGKFGDLRMVIVGGKTHAVQVMRQVLGIIGVRQIQAVADAAAAIDLLCHQSFSAVFCDETVLGAGGLDFGRAARRAKGLLNPMVPIFLVCGGPRRRDVEAARDAGFTDVLTRPVSAATIMRKLDLALGRPRPFIVASDFFGPDRRGGPRAWFRGEDRRTRQPRKVKVGLLGGTADADQVFV